MIAHTEETEIPVTEIITEQKINTMATLSERYEMSQNPDFQNRVRGAMIDNAIKILGETKGTMPAEQTRKRQVMASLIMSWQGINLMAWTMAVLNNPSVSDKQLTAKQVSAEGAISYDPATAATDADIDYTITQIWDDMSGVTALDLVPDPII